MADSYALALGLPKQLPENCREWRPCTWLDKTNARKWSRIASLLVIYPNHCHKIAESCALALDLPKPLHENFRELRPCAGLTKTTARKLQRVAPLHWAYQSHCQKIPEGGVLALGLPKALPDNCRGLHPCSWFTQTTARKLPRAAPLHCTYQNH